MKKIIFYQRKVLITGASAGIGKALSREFARRGAWLALGCLPGEAIELENWSQELQQTYGIKTWTFPVDLLEDNGPERLYKAVVEQAGQIFALVNNAGMVSYGNFWNTSWERQYQTFQLNLYVPMRLMYLFLPGMIEQGQGVVFNTSSVSALQPTPFQSIYGATKAGLQSMSEAIRAELKGTGVSVCTLNPPYINTRLLKTDGYPPDLRFYSISGIKDPEWLAEHALKAFEKDRMLYVPGLSSKIIHLFLPRISPRWLIDVFARFFMQGWKNPHQS
ncbi:MAG: SDR family NAD(P)-dependent oxidoreductase [Deltaproteobacteria bacterium]|nr:SDR family NAD(P)-dependent oxidoreductase [Deltaproteobacteria bacterium]